MSDNPVTHARARLAALTRHNPHGDHTDARRDLAAANIAAYVRKVVDAAPPLTDEQRDRLTLLLRGPSNTGGAAA